ncbi:MFS transporter [Streptomyces sp. NPDC046862]|uniref:MFS transporter n=1 Tax=Streptomyces sp. NPDC046862 TaxID=3154603 RepID=UPI003453A052
MPRGAAALRLQEFPCSPQPHPPQTLNAPPLSPAPKRWPPVIWALLIGTFAVRAPGFVYPYLPYRLDELHLDTVAASTVLALWGAGWFTGQLLCGWLADRIGRRTTLASAMTVAAAGFPLLAAPRSPRNPGCRLRSRLRRATPDRVCPRRRHRPGRTGSRTHHRLAALRRQPGRRHHRACRRSPRVRSNAQDLGSDSGGVPRGTRRAYLPE